MSTWICDPRLTLIAAAFLLAGCLEGFGAGARAPETVRVAGGEVTIGGPDGYCIDPQGSSESEASSFVLLGSCAALREDPDGPHPDRLAVLTATVSKSAGGPRVADTLDDLAEVFASPAGRAMLSRSGDAESVTLLETQESDGVLLLRLQDESPHDGPEVAREYWRAVLDAGERMVMLSVIPLSSRPLSADAGRALLDAFLARVQGENAAAEEAPASGEVQEAEADATPPPGGTEG